MQLFPEFIAKKKKWILLVASYLLDVKKRSLDDYLADFLILEMPLDEIGIFLFARMMHRHVTVCFNDLWWSTRSDGDSSNVDCILIYRGKCIYVPTVPMSPEEYVSNKLYLESVQKAWHENEAKKIFNESTERWIAKEDSCTLQEKDDHVLSTSMPCTMSETGDYCTVHGFWTDFDNGCTLQKNTDDMAATGITCTM